MRASNKQILSLKLKYLANFSSAVTPEPDSTEDSTAGLDPTDLAIVPSVTTSSRTSPNSRRMSQPITGTPKEPDSNDPSNTRRASEGKSVEKGQSDLIRCFNVSLKLYFCNSI